MASIMVLEPPLQQTPKEILPNYGLIQLTTVPTRKGEGVLKGGSCFSRFMETEDGSLPPVTGTVFLCFPIFSVFFHFFIQLETDVV